MSIAERMLIEFDYEMKNTRNSLARVPDDKLGWKPHPKSFTLAQLSGHIAEIPSWILPTIQQTELNLNPPGGTPYKTPVAKSREELLLNFDNNVETARPVLAGASDDLLRESWSLLAGEHTIFSMPRVGVLRSFILNHLIHHRAQLGMYFRLNDIPVPAVYGPSADEQ